MTVIGFSKKIVYRNNAKYRDDIYVTGNLGDSYLGLKLIENKINIIKKSKKYFVNKYYCPDIPFLFSKKLLNFANTSIDISDGLISDIEKLINNQKISYEININKIPISKSLNDYLKKNNKDKKDFVFKGDDYQILFTSAKKNRRLIRSIAKKMNQKVTIIGKINNNLKSNMLLQNDKTLKLAKYKGYSHMF